MRMARTTAAFVGIGLLTGFMVGCATAQQPAATGTAMSQRDSVAERQRLMKLHGALWRDIQDKHKAGNIAAIPVSAEALAINASRIPSLFPEGSLTDTSKAKPEIWQRWSDFEAAAKKLESESERLRDAAQAKDAQATDAIMKDFGRQACGTCHTPFRVPPAR
jgi:cytochrome c556